MIATPIEMLLHSYDKTSTILLVRIQNMKLPITYRNSISQMGINLKDLSSATESHKIIIKQIYTNSYTNIYGTGTTQYRFFTIFFLLVLNRQVKL